MSLLNSINKVCKEIPKNYIIKLCMENGSAWVEAFDWSNEHRYSEVYCLSLPDSTDKNLQEELNDALI